ncbi:S41 family peptidase [uncultured Pseudoteredinibacter sp.]|uniref:S41 family peptidase n=1 Tax=uncultured Pseudoteredinibacter sp. TaxID=1641701 RepID=UPI002634D0A1|nr:S41 family peptidase [uncultured Pseudoteredinibacter sp.]
MKAFAKLILPCFFLFSNFLYAETNNNISSEGAYDKAQAMRSSAYKFIDANKIQKSEETLEAALNFVRQPDIVAMYQENQYLAGRQWDILRDLIIVNALQQDKPNALSYLRQLTKAKKSLARIAKDEDVAALLAEETLFVNAVKAEKAWARIQANDGLSSPYTENLSDAEKIAGLSTIWSEAKHGFVYFDQVPSLDWDKLYQNTIPKVLNTQSTLAYYRELERFIAQLKDSHSDISYPKALRSKAYSRPPFRTRLIEDKVIVTDIYSKSLGELGIAIGDELLEIEGQAVHQYATEHKKPFNSSSTLQDLEVRTYRYTLLSGDSEKNLNIKLKKADGSHKNLSVPREGYSDTRYPEANEFTLLESGIAYFRTNSFASNKAAEHFKNILPQLKNAKGLIIDVRQNGGGSSTVGFRILQYLTDKAVSGSYSYSRLNQPVRKAWGDNRTHWKDLGGNDLYRTAKKQFDKPVMVLAGPQSFSAAEDFLVAFKQLQRGLIIGETSAGSSGQPLVFELPGGGSARVCVKRDQYSNGDDWVGVGIAPDIVVKESVEDVRAGVDVVLDAAEEKVLEGFRARN